MIRRTDTAFTLMSMELNTKASGRMIYKTVLVSKPGRMDLDMKVTIKTEKSTAKELMYGAMDQSTLENGEITRLLDT